MLSVAFMSRTAASLPPYMGSKLGLRPNIIALLMLRAGPWPCLETSKFFLHRDAAAFKAQLRFGCCSRGCHSFSQVAGLGGCFSPGSPHFFKDMKATKADAATDDHELSHEIGLLCKGTD